MEVNQFNSFLDGCKYTFSVIKPLINDPDTFALITRIEDTLVGEFVNICKENYKEIKETEIHKLHLQKSLVTLEKFKNKKCILNVGTKDESVSMVSSKDNKVLIEALQGLIKEELNRQDKEDDNDNI